MLGAGRPYVMAKPSSLAAEADGEGAVAGRQRPGSWRRVPAPTLAEAFALSPDLAAARSSLVATLKRILAAIAAGLPQTTVGTYGEPCERAPARQRRGRGQVRFPRLPA